MQGGTGEGGVDADNLGEGEKADKKGGRSMNPREEEEEGQVASGLAGPVGGALNDATKAA